MPKFAQGRYNLKFPEKYLGRKPCIDLLGVCFHEVL